MTCGNPLLGSANGKRVAEAYKRLEFYVYTGFFMEEAAYYVDVILPACRGLEMETVYVSRARGRRASAPATRRRSGR